VINLSGIAPELLRDFGQPVTLEWDGEDTLDGEGGTVTLSTYAFITQNKVWNGSAVVSQLEAYLPATERSIHGAKLLTGGRPYRIQSFVEIGGVGTTAAVQIAVIA